MPGWLRGVRPPSEETAFLLAFSAVVLAVVILHARGAVDSRPDVPQTIAFESVASMPVGAPAAASASTAAVVPPPPVAVPLVDRPAVQPAPAVQPVGPPAPSTVRSVDLKTLPALSNLTTQTGTSFNLERVTYGDLSGAGEVALVPLESGGTAGTLAVAVVGVGKDGPQVLALLSSDTSERSRLRVTSEGGLIVMTRGVLGPEDPLCCPSETKRSYYAWDGKRLQLQRETSSQNVSAKN